jgi:hypothetical protein
MWTLLWAIGEVFLRFWAVLRVAKEQQHGRQMNSQRVVEHATDWCAKGHRLEWILHSIWLLPPFLGQAEPEAPIWVPSSSWVRPRKEVIF